MDDSPQLAIHYEIVNIIILSIGTCVYLSELLPSLTTKLWYVMHDLCQFLKFCFHKVKHVHI